MTQTTAAPPLPHYQAAPPTTEALDYADIAVVDLSKFSTPEGRVAELTETVRDAMHTQGVFYVINHGWSSEQKNRIFDIADASFSQVSDEEKKKYLSRILETGSFQGYKLRQYWHVDGGVLDQVETYNVNRIVTKRDHPDALRPLLPELDAFARHNHFNILHPILRLLAMGLELPEDSFVKQHNWDAIGETYIRFMKYYPRSAEEEAKSNNVWLKGHTDTGSITLLWSQPIAALQILEPDGKWRWVKHIDNALLVNAGDCMEFLSGGYYRPVVHRVVQPPADQRGRARLGAFYFALPDDAVALVPDAQSLVLQRAGVRRRVDDAHAPTTEGWRKGRSAAYGKSELKSGEQAGVEEEYISGVLVKHYK